MGVILYGVANIDKPAFSTNVVLLLQASPMYGWMADADGPGTSTKCSQGREGQQPGGQAILHPCRSREDVSRDRAGRKPCSVWEKMIPDRRNSKCKGFGTGPRSGDSHKVREGVECEPGTIVVPKVKPQAVPALGGGLSGLCSESLGMVREALMLWMMTQ